MAHSPGMYYYAKRQGWLDEICKYDKQIRKWTYEKVKEVAEKSRNRREFIEKFAGAYQWAKRNGFYKEIASYIN